jgi:hypothetical protein
MSTHSNLKRVSGCLAVLALSAACVSYSAASPSVAAVTVSGPLPADLVSTIQKPNGSGIAVRYRVDGAVVAHQPIMITLIFDGVKNDAATVHFTADTELQFGDLSALVTLPQGSSQIDLRVTPQSDGLFYVNVFTSQAGATSVISVPVLSGSVDPKLRKLGESKPAAGGERIISLPVH